MQSNFLHRKLSMVSIRCIIPIRVLEALCLADTLTRTIRLLHHLNLLVIRSIHTHRHPSMDLLVMDLISRMV